MILLGEPVSVQIHRRKAKASGGVQIKGQTPASSLDNRYPDYLFPGARRILHRVAPRLPGLRNNRGLPGAPAPWPLPRSTATRDGCGGGWCIGLENAGQCGRTGLAHGPRDNVARFFECSGKRFKLRRRQSQYRGRCKDVAALGQATLNGRQLGLEIGNSVFETGAARPFQSKQVFRLACTLHVRFQKSCRAEQIFCVGAVRHQVRKPAQKSGDFLKISGLWRGVHQRCSDRGRSAGKWSERS
jgi:hypothetical protein